MVKSVVAQASVPAPAAVDEKPKRGRPSKRALELGGVAQKSAPVAVAATVSATAKDGDDNAAPKRRASPRRAKRSYLRLENRLKAITADHPMLRAAQFRGSAKTCIVEIVDDIVEKYAEVIRRMCHHGKLGTVGLKTARYAMRFIAEPYAEFADALDDSATAKLKQYNAVRAAERERRAAAAAAAANAVARG